MSTRNNHSPFRAGDRVSEPAARRAIAHFRAAAVTGAPAAAHDTANATVNDRRETRRSPTDPQILRRWVLADLIAGARQRRAFA